MSGKFLKVECPGCRNIQVVYNRPSGIVKCLACDKTLAKPTGGRGRILCKIVKVLK